MGDKQKVQGKIEVAGIVGPLWFAAWLFTIGYLHLSFGKAFLGILLWPFYLGRSFAP